MTISTPERLGALALIAALAVGACSSSGASTAPSAAATTAPTAAPPSAAAASDAASAPASAAAVSCVAGSITAAGSTAMQPVVDAAAKLYATACPGSTVNVQGGGSGTGLTQVSQGAIQIGNSDVTAEEKLTADQAAALVDHVVLKQGWVQVINPSVTGITNLTTQQSADIWTGKVTNWKDIPGGPDQAIVLILRPASSGTRATFKKVVLGGADEAAGSALTEDSNGAVAKAVGTTPGSISVVGLAYYQANKAGINQVQLDGIDATPATIADGTYKLSANGNMYTKGAATGLTEAFIDFMLGPQVQGTLIPSLFYAPAS